MFFRVYNKWAVLIFPVLVLGVCFSAFGYDNGRRGPGGILPGEVSNRPGMGYNQQRGPGQNGDRGRADAGSRVPQDVGDAVRAVRDSLEEIFEMVNAGQDPSEAQVKGYRMAMLGSGRYRNEMSIAEQSAFYMLYSWVSYFEGDLSKAAQAGGRAFQLSPECNNAAATYTVMTAIGGGEPELLERKEMLVRRAGNSYRGPISLSNGLDFDADSYMTEMSGKQFGAMDIECVGSAGFSYRPGGRTVCFVLWQLDDKTEKATAGQGLQEVADPCGVGGQQSGYGAGGSQGEMSSYRPGMGGYGPSWDDSDEVTYSSSSGETSDLSGLKKLFAENYDNPAIGFVGINTDSCANADKAVKRMIGEPTPWVQAMACKQTGAAGQFNDIDNQGTHLVIVSPEGKVIYAGQPVGFMPVIILKASGALKHSGGAAEGQGQSGQGGQGGGILGIFKNLTNSQGEGGSGSVQQNQGQEKPAAGQAIGDPDERLSDTDKYWCEQKLSQAKTMIDKGHTAGMFLGYRDGVEICKQILEKHPQTTYAQRARDLLNQVPERYHQRYGITDEMLGR